MNEQRSSAKPALSDTEFRLVLHEDSPSRGSVSGACALVGEGVAQGDGGLVLSEVSPRARHKTRGLLTERAMQSWAALG